MLKSGQLISNQIQFENFAAGEVNRGDLHRDVRRQGVYLALFADSEGVVF